MIGYCCAIMLSLLDIMARYERKYELYRGGERVVKLVEYDEKNCILL